MKRLILFTLLLAAVSTVVWSLRQPSLDTMRADTAQARLQKIELEKLGKQLATTPTENIDQNELDRLRALRPELARLRGGIGELRQLMNQNPEQLRTKAQAAMGEASLVRARREAKARSKAVDSSIGMCSTLVTEAAINTDGLLPRNWIEVQQKILSAATNKPSRLHYMTDLLARASGPKGFLGDFEILPISSNIVLKKNQQNVQIPIIREIQARQQPDGGFARYYAWTDGRTEEVIIPDGNFSAWESKNAIPAAATASAR